MDRSRAKGTVPDEEDGEQADGSEDEEVEMPTSHAGVPETSVDTLVVSFWTELHQDQDKLKKKTELGDVIAEGRMEVLDPEMEETSPAPSVSPISLMDTCAPSISSLSSASYLSSNHHRNNVSSSSSSSSVLSLTPPLPPSVELSAVLTDTRLSLDVYLGGAAALSLLWASIPEQLSSLQYLRLGSEDKAGLDGALDVLPHLTELRSLAIRGHCLYDSQGDPLPGLLTTLPRDFSSLSHLVHLDLSFNQLTCLPSSLLSISTLTSLLLCHNRLAALPPDIGLFPSLSYLSLLGNELVSLPASVGQLKALHTLDVSHNCLQHLPDEIGSLVELVKLELSYNKLKQLPETMGSLLSLRELVIYSNELRLIPDCLNKLPGLKIDKRDNPLGQPRTPPPLSPTPDRPETSIPELHLGFNQHSFCVSSAGCHVFLPGGAELLFPPGCVVTTTRLEWIEKRPERKWVWLEEHDILLSRPLELRPHGIKFLMPVEVCVPYHRTKRKEVVVRKFDGHSWITLPTNLRRGSESHSSHPGGRLARLACCSVSQFSWFMAVSRLVKDTCSVTPTGALLVSSSDPGVKLHFPPDCTVQTRTINLQVLEVSMSEVQTLCGDPQARVSPLLCLSQSPNTHFLQPVKVQIPLPPGVTGHTVDKTCLHLLHGDPTAQTWTDITTQVSLHITHVYAIFYITHFSWYWLWYTTRCYVSGVARKVYQRLKQFKVQFLVLQRKTDPSQVLLQCLPVNKVEGRIQSLSEQYDGPQPSELCDLLEGEQFFAGFERGLDISTDRPDCVQGRLCFMFYSSLKNLKEVYICPTEGQKGPVRGQVSFYRGEIPSHLPEEVVRKRKGNDSQWLATLPLRLPALNLDNSYCTEELQHPPLNLGDPESGYLTEANLLSISLQIGQDWRVIGINLGLSYQELDRIQYKHRDNLAALVLDMLFHWARGQSNTGPGVVSKLVAAMMESGRRDIADEIEDIVSIGRRKYSQSLRRLGLEAESSSLEENSAAAEP
ncbi:p53-induced death domain-containing protein 1-like [Solea senegalensis]|uniref:Leucine-rich repeat protein SHOC-2 n=1 Tax=Solea senegalensis TaxID=28829 RepID=A0AAV6T1G8_SOLSE|nr:p53-induced death domain-containing protein 1 [Solea senegalensis]KAG7523252.1 p53-induced death domain-containing protein 1-like [Solea senegalensis]